jgi:hypothetical protein
LFSFLPWENREQTISVVAWGWRLELCPLKNPTRGEGRQEEATGMPEDWRPAMGGAGKTRKRQ